MEIQLIRTSEYDVDPLFYQRWSPRAFQGYEISDRELKTLFEAAKWAPSCFNEQPWLFLYTKKSSEHWPLFLGFLVEMNQSWAKEASVLIVLISNKNFSRNNKPNESHTLDSGSSWQSLALQAHLMGLAAHGMAGFDKDAARRGLNIPENYQLEMMIAVGKPGPKELLAKSLQEKEIPSSRKKLSEIMREGKFS